MRERSSQIVLLIRAFEEVDRDGRIVPVQSRAAATRRALRVTGLADWSGDLHEAHNIRNGETVMRRARLLFDSLARKIPALRGVLRVASLAPLSAPAVMLITFALGLSADALGPDRRINLLSVPLLATLAWNLAIYAWWGLSRITRLSSDSRVAKAKLWSRGAAESLSGLLLKSAIRRRTNAWKRSDDGDTESLRITGRAILRFGALWQRCAGKLLAARVQRVLHVGSLAFALGLVGGIYLRGIALAYEATWESTWLTAARVQSLMHGILGPASLVLGKPLPDVAPLEAPLHGAAAPWIHLFAVTVLLAVILPRAALVLWESLRCTRLAADLPIDFQDGYCRSLFRDWRGSTTSVEIVPYSYAPTDAALESLKNGLRDYFGSRADLRLLDALAYGDAVDRWIAPASAEGPWKPARDVGGDLEDHQVTHCRVVLFNLAQPPEPEVHGLFLEELQARAGERGDRVLVILDGESFERHVRQDSRKTERVRAWQRITRQAGLEGLLLQSEPEAEFGAQSIERAIRPRDGARTDEPES